MVGGGRGYFWGGVRRICGLCMGAVGEDEGHGFIVVLSIVDGPLLE